MKNLLISIKITVAFCIILSVGYVAVLWGVAAVTQPNAGNAEVLMLDGKVVGASNVGQQFTQMNYFWPRPSAVNYNGSGSGGSNKGVTNEEYLSEVSARVDAFLVAHPYLKRSDVPAEIVTASGSGLDPHISISSAMVQVRRVAESCGMSVDDVKKIVESVTETPMVGVPTVNVLKLNIALDANLQK